MNRKSCHSSLVIAVAGILISLLMAPRNLNATDEQEQQINRFSIRIGNLRQEIKIHLEKIRETGQKEINILDELKQLNERLSRQKDKLTTLRERLTAQEQLLAMKERDLKQAEVVKENIRKHLEKRLRSFYLMGKTGFLNVAFASDSLPNLMRFNDSFRNLLNYDQSVIDMYHDTIDQLTRTNEAIKLEKSLLQNFIAQSSAEQKNLDELHQQKTELLARIKSEKALYQQAVAEMKKAEAGLTEILVKTKTEKMLKDQEFMLSHGQLPPPVSGKVIRRFRQKIEGEEIENSIIDGISIDAPENSPVCAVSGGKVIYSGYLRGYGNVIILDHGFQYYSLTGRLDKLLKKEDDQVTREEVIGMSGGIANLFEKGVYFEIRHGTEPLDPLAWLRSDAFPNISPQTPPVQAAVGDP